MWLLCLLWLSNWVRLLLWWLLEGLLLRWLALRGIASDLWLLRRRLKARLLSWTWVPSELRLDRAGAITCWLRRERRLWLLLLLLEAVERLLWLSKLARRGSRAAAASHERA